MRTYFAIVHQEGDSAFGVTFPDLPGCFSAADDLLDLYEHAQDALALYAEEGQPLLMPQTIMELRRQTEIAADLAAGAFLMAVPLIVRSGNSRYNVMLDSALVEGIDLVAARAGISRSEFIAQAAGKSLKETSRIVVAKVAGRGAKAATAASKVLHDPKASKLAKSAASAALTQSKSNETTSAKAASAASKVLKDPKASKDEKTAAASALTQKVKRK